MLTFAALAMSLYAVYSMGWAAIDLFRGAQLETWAEVGLIGFGALLAFASIVVRARIPGGLAFTVAALLGLQALDVHNAAHLDTPLGLQVARAAFGLVVAAAVWIGGLERRGHPTRDPRERQRADTAPAP